jgi:uncharacterized protein YneF (UPF0154 family)
MDNVTFDLDRNHIYRMFMLGVILTYGAIYFAARILQTYYPNATGSISQIGTLAVVLLFVVALAFGWTIGRRVMSNLDRRIQIKYFLIACVFLLCEFVIIPLTANLFPNVYSWIPTWLEALNLPVSIVMAAFCVGFALGRRYFSELLVNQHKLNETRLKAGSPES